MSQPPPFVIFSLPRSRSTWLSVYLSKPGRVIGHDIGVECKSPQDFIAKLGAGTCETGAAFAAPVIRKLVPDVKIVVIRRDVWEVSQSLDGLELGWHLQEMTQRARDLANLSAQSGVLTKTFHELETFEACDEIHRFCLGEPADRLWWEKMSRTNVQIDIPWQMSRLKENAGGIAALKEAVRSHATL